MKPAKKKKKTNWKHWLPFYLMGLPGFIYLFINNYMPLMGLQIAFKDFKYNLGIWKSPWVGLKNFEFLFATGDAAIMIRNTLLYNIVWIVLGIVVGVGAAILLNEVYNAKLKKFYQTVILMPYLMSMVVIAYLVFAYLSPTNGLVNGILEALGKSPIEFYAETKYWPFILTFVNQWKNIGFGMILYLSTIVGIDKSLYEAAQLDGASKWKQHRFITIPLIKPTIIMLFIMNVGQIFRSDFGLFYQVPMNSGVLFPTTNVIDTYVYRALIEQGNISMSSAAGVYQSLVGFCVVMLSNWIVRKVDKDQALF